MKLGLARHAFQNFLIDLGKRLEEDEISPSEFTTFCLLPCLHPKPQVFQRSPLLKFKFVETHSTIMEWLKNHSWKGHTDRIRSTLLNWHLGHFPLILWDRIPTPLELLKIQAQGQRVITVFRQVEEWDQIHHGKNAWDFTVHDLVHASHFFEKPEWRDGQIEFYKMILRNWDHPMIRSLREFETEAFDYLISDMNSHPQHMMQTLRAIGLKAFKTSKGVDQKTVLPTALENEFAQQTLFT